MFKPPRLAARAVLLHEDRLLLVNAWKGRTHLWCAPGGGVNGQSSLPDNLAREVHEETGLVVTVGAPCLVNEYADEARDFHQVEVFFRCTLISGALDPTWEDPEGIVSHSRWVTRAEMETMSVKPSSLAAVAWKDPDAPTYDPLEPLAL
jgi:ADP-ribose pyrophosphatase YjhB (NUDIX family)